MILPDVNLLVLATATRAPDHIRAKQWLDDLLRSAELVGIPWAVLVGFVRVRTNPRAVTDPFTVDEALEQVAAWLALPGVVALQPTSRHEYRFAELCRSANATGNLVSDAHLAALAIEHNCVLASNDADFSRFPGLRWFNPLVQEE